MLPHGFICAAAPGSRQRRGSRPKPSPRSRLVPEPFTQNDRCDHSCKLGKDERGNPGGRKGAAGKHERIIPPLPGEIPRVARSLGFSAEAHRVAGEMVSRRMLRTSFASRAFGGRLFELVSRAASGYSYLMKSWVLKGPRLAPGAASYAFMASHASRSPPPHNQTAS